MPDDNSLVYICVRAGCVCSRLLVLNYSANSALTIHNRWENPHLFSFKGEIAGLSLIWVFYISGAAVATVCLHQHVPSSPF